MSTISSTIRPMRMRRRPANTSTGWRARRRPSPGSGRCVTSGISWPRYCTTQRPLEVSIVLRSISSRRATRASGTAFGAPSPARNSSSGTFSSLWPRDLAAILSAPAFSTTPVWPECGAMPFGSRIMMTLPSPRIVLPENIVDVAQDRRHRLHDDFLGVEHAVDHDAEAVGADLGDDDEGIVARTSLRQRRASAACAARPAAAGGCAGAAPACP